MDCPKCGRRGIWPYWKVFFERRHYYRCPVCEHHWETLSGKVIVKIDNRRDQIHNTEERGGSNSAIHIQ